MLLSFALISIPFRLTPTQTGSQPSGGSTSRANSGNKVYGVIVGVAKFESRGIPWLKYADRDANAFGAYLGAEPGIQIFQDNRATLPAVRAAVRKALTQEAGPTDDVYLFFSGRGTADTDLDDGFILLSESNPGRGASTAFSSKELAGYIRQSSARKIFLVADLCRDPDQTPRKNLITAKLAGLADLKPSVTAIFASKVNQHSSELEAQKSGVFSYYLLNGLQAKMSNLQALMTFLLAKVPAASPTHQVPFFEGITAPSLVTLPLGRVDNLHKVARQSGFRSPFMLAAYQQPESDPETFHQQLTSAMENNPAAAVQLFYSAPKTLQESERDAFAISLEERGQRELVRYGEGDQFPGDPQRPLKREFEIASTAFEQASLIRPNAPFHASLLSRHLFSAGRAKLFDRDYDAARTALQEAISTQPEYPEAYNALGISFLDNADYRSAIRYFQQAIVRAPDWAYARHNLALAYIESGNYAAGEREYRDAIARTPFQPYLYYNLGVLLHRLNRKNDAKVEYKHAIDVFEDRIREVTAYVQRSAAEGRPTFSKVLSERLDVLVKNEAEVYNALGAIAQAQGNKTAAEAAYQNARTKNPKLLLATYNLGTLLAQRKDMDGAIQLWREVLQQDEHHLPSILRLAETYEKQGKGSEAVEEYRNALQLKPDSSLAAHVPELLADISAAKGDTQNACAQYTLAESRAPQERKRVLHRKVAKWCPGLVQKNH